jgi:predicted glycoside hydrolase/deacetylase ChbG (UPF0249 family)
MSTPARYLIVNADDFGLSDGVNQGILDAHRHGIVTSTSLMVLAPAAAQAARGARENPDLSVGLHFVEPDDAELDDPAQAQAAFAAQLERFCELVGRDPTHVDSHHHVHTTQERMTVFRELVRPLGVPLRGSGEVAYIGGFWAQWEPGVTDLQHVSRPHLLWLIEAEAGPGFTELACHPARVIGDFRSSYLQERQAELETLTQPGLRDEVRSSGVSLVSYHDWPDGPRR